MESSDLNMAVSLAMLCAIPVGLWIQYLIVKRQSEMVSLRPIRL
jgi:hypothetical protein